MLFINGKMNDMDTKQTKVNLDAETQLNYEIDSRLKNKMVKKYVAANDKGRYRFWTAVSFVLMAVGVLLFGGVCATPFFFMHKANFANVTVSAVVGSFFLMVFIPLGLSLKRYTIRRLGRPYSEMEREVVHFEKAGLELYYHDREGSPYQHDNEFGEKNFYPNRNKGTVYQIGFEDIKNVEYDSDCMLLTLTGVADVTAYDDYNLKRINVEKSGAKFYPDSRYSFILASSQAEKILKIINDNINLEEDPVSVAFDYADEGRQVINGISIGGDMPDEAKAFYTFVLLIKLAECAKGMEKVLIYMASEENGIKTTAYHKKDRNDYQHSVVRGEKQVDLKDWLNYHRDKEAMEYARKILDKTKKELIKNKIAVDEVTLSASIREYGF